MTGYSTCPAPTSGVIGLGLDEKFKIAIDPPCDFAFHILV
jgi:hypothetical protein